MMPSSYKKVGSAALLALFIYAGSTSAQTPYAYRPADRSQIGKTKGDEVMIMPVTYLREYDPVTVMFGKVMNPSGNGPLDKPDQYVTIKPPQPGEYRWIDQRTIEFKPAVPWKVMQSYTVRSMGVTKTLSVLLSPPQSVYPAPGSSGIDPLSRIEITFAQPVTVEALARLVSFETCPLPGIETANSKRYGPADYRIKVSERSDRSSYKYWFIFPRPFENGLRVRTTVKLINDATLPEAKRVYYFDTRKAFTIERAGTYEYQFTMNPSGITYGREQALRLSQDGTIIIDFSEPPASLSLSQVKSLLSFSPSPRRTDWTISGSRLTVRLSVDQERLYNVVLGAAAIVDKDGRTLKLKKQNSFYCYQPLDKQYSRWGIGYGTVERYGPQHFPLLVNGVKSVDMRIYRIDAAHNAFTPFPSSPLRVDESVLPPGPGEEPTLTEEIFNALSVYEMSNHIRMLGSPHYSAILDLEKEGVSRFQSIDLKPLFAGIAGENRPGTYLVGFRPLDGSTERAYVRVQVTDLCLSTVESRRQATFAVTSLSKGKPVADAEVLIEALSTRNGRLVNDTIELGRTDNDGLYVLNHDFGRDTLFRNARIRRVTVQKDDDMVLFDGETSSGIEEFSNNHWYSDRSSWLTWLSADGYDFKKDSVSAAFVFTERPIYRPNETVYFKGFVRTLYHGRIVGPNESKGFSAQIISPSGENYNFPITFSSVFSFNDSLAENDLPTGEYRLQLLGRGGVLAATAFSIEAYRIPKFEVKLAGPDKTQNDRPVSVKCIATYFAGGKVTGQNVAWKVVSYPYSYEPRSAAGYLLSTDNRYGALEEERQEGVIEQSGTTDDNGSATLMVNPQSATDGNPRKYNCEVTVTDEDEQTVSNRHSFVALPPFSLGLKVDRHITGTATIAAQIVAVGINGDFEPNHTVTVQLKKMSWNSYLQETDFSRGKPKYLTQESVDLIAEKKVTTAKKPAAVEFDNQDPGVYILEISARDRLGRMQSVKADIFLAGSKPVTWKRADQQLFETVPDRTSYKPGDRASILLKSPFQRGVALAVVERPTGTPEYRWVEVSDGQGTFTLPIEGDMAPKIPVSFLLMRGRIADEKRLPDGSTVDAGKPQTVANTTWLMVDQTDNILSVALDHPTTVRPGTALPLTVTLKDGSGAPRPGEVALWLVDEAVLSLAKEKPLNPLPSFTTDVRSWITLRDSRNFALGDLRIPLTPGGDGGEEGGDLFGKITVRKNFKTVPYWNPSLLVDKSGKTTVTIRMSDDLTNFSVRAVAASGTDRFGVGTSKIRVRLPILVQPSLPRFVRLGDKLHAGGVARVVEGSGGAAAYTVQTKGLTIAGPAGPAGSVGPTDIKLDNVKPLSLLSDLAVVEPGFDTYGNLRADSVTITMAVVRKSDKASDAFSVSLPLRMDRPFEEEDLYATLKTDKPLTIAALPGKARPNTLSRQVLLSDQMAILKAVAGMTALVRYPYGCTEQQVSRVYPAIAYRDIWATYGLDAPMGNIKKYVAETMEYLASVQDQEGLFGYWPGSAGYAYLTAYAVDFLTEVKHINEASKSGYAFDEPMYARALAALGRTLRSDYTRYVDGYRYYERACALYSLAKAGKLDIGYARELANIAAANDVQSMARICEALQKNAPSLGSEISKLNKKLWEQTVYKLDNGKEVFAGLQERSFVIGARVHTSEITALAAMISAFGAAQKRDKRLPDLVGELVTLGGNNDWGSTQANCLSLLALRDYVSKPMGKTKFSLAFSGGGDIEQITYDAKKGATVKRWSDGIKRELRLQSSSDGTPCLVRYSQRWLPLAPGYTAPAVQKGFVVKREFVFVKEDTMRRVWIDSASMTHTLRTGDIIEEHIRVENPKDRYFVAVAAPFAAGLEYMNPLLETSGEDARPANTTTNSGTYQTFLDDQVVYYFEHMRAGTYDFYFRERASVAGEFSHPSARAEMMYEMATYGCSPGTKIVVKGEK
jgi:alpha-2-macroglobulin